jgi:hypothetical protein
MHRGYQSDFRPMASEHGMAYTMSRGAGEVKLEEGTGKGRIHTAFHDGVELCMTASSGGVSFRMWESHARHSAGTCEALRSCYRRKQTFKLARFKSFRS